MAAFCRSLIPVTHDSEACAWLRNRPEKIDAAEVEDRHLAGVLPYGVRLPSWASSSAGPWNSSGHRLALPLFDAAGALVSVRVRALGAPTPSKALPPQGYQVVGTLLADSLGRELLAGRADEQVREVGICILEGEPHFLSWATKLGDAADKAPAFLGLFQGSWTPEIASRIPDGTRIAVRTHDDPKGHAYANQIAATLADRCELIRAPEPNL